MGRGGGKLVDEKNLKKGMESRGLRCGYWATDGGVSGA